MKAINKNWAHCVEIIGLILAAMTTMVDSTYYYYSYSYSYYYYNYGYNYGYNYYYYGYYYNYNSNSSANVSAGGVVIIVIVIILIITLLVFKIAAVCLMRCYGIRYRTAWCILCCCKCNTYREYERTFYSYPAA